jgi:hypothetical protein
MCKLVIEDLTKDFVLRISLSPVFNDSEHVLELCRNFENWLALEMVGVRDAFT